MKKETMKMTIMQVLLLLVTMCATAESAAASELRYFPVAGTNRIACTVLPPGRLTSGGKAGLVIHLPGAGGGHTFYNLSRPPYAALRRMLAERGYWIVVPSLGNSWMNDKAVASMDALIAEMKKAEKIDPTRIHIIGTSMGAGSGLIYVSKRPNNIRSICAIFPMTDFNAWISETPRYFGPIAQAYGLDRGALESVLAERSPIRHPEAFVNVPVFLLHGDSDKIVLPHHSRDFAAALTARGCSVTFHEARGFGHEDKIAEAYQKKIADFLTGVIDSNDIPK